jgi:hypothetical protein
MNDGVAAFLQGLDYAGMIVPQSRAHLAGVKIQVLFPVNVADYRTTAPHHDRSSHRIPVQAAPEAVLSGQVEEFFLSKLVSHQVYLK